MRVVALDPGRHRTGIALSDPSGTLASPYGVIRGQSLRTQWADLVALLTRLAEDDTGLAAIVVGVPVRLDGSPTDFTDEARGLAERLARRFPVPVIARDERLTSVDAEARLALTERDWRRRKAKLDAAAAAVILQDYLDER
jgi:putative Holliday junction resolvase